MILSLNTPILKKPFGGGGTWRRFILSEGTKVDPNVIDNGSIEENGYSRMKVNSGADTRLIQNGLVFYKRLPDVDCSDVMNIGVAIELVDATSGAPGSAAANLAYLACGITSDPTALATRAQAIGYEHGSAGDPKCYTEQASVQSLGGASASGRHSAGNIMKYKGGIKRFSNACLTGITYDNPLGQVSSNVGLNPAGASDPLYIFVFAGRGAAGAFDLKARFWFTYSKGIA